LSVVSVVCCQVEVSAADWSLVQRSPTDCGASCVIKKPENEEAKARYRAMENTTMGCNTKKTNKHTYIHTVRVLTNISSNVCSP
jgi:hypothetical protein